MPYFPFPASATIALHGLALIMASIKLPEAVD